MKRKLSEINDDLIDETNNNSKTNSYINTYTSGYKLKINKDITTNDIAILCEKLTKTFNDHYKTNEYSFVPEKIGGGGILFLHYPNKTEEEYKSFRFTDSSVKWIWIDEDYDNVISNWKKKNVLLRKCFYNKYKDNIYTTLKAFDNAPYWTLEELNLFESCFKEIEITVIKNSYPNKKKLIH